MSVKLASTLPADDRNGLDALNRAAVDNPERVHVIIALVDCSEIRTKVDTGDVVPVFRVRAIEGFSPETADGKELRRFWRRRYEERTGQTVLPLEIERALDDLGVHDETDDAT
jgi:hypothetical protein